MNECPPVDTHQQCDRILISEEADWFGLQKKCATLYKLQ